MLVRPVVLVYQSVATPTVSPTTPDLNCLIVGPSFHIQDYFTPGSTSEYADKTDILLTEAYGTLEDDPGAATPTGAAVITVTDAPNNVVGALVDADSVVVYFDEARVEIVSGTNGTTSASTPNQFDVSDSVDFTTGVEKVLPGDRVIISDGSNTIARTVLSVTDADTLLFTEDLPTGGFTPGSGQDWRLERRLNDQLVDASFFSVNGNTITIDGDITLSANSDDKTVTYAKVYVEYRALRQDLSDLGVVEQTSDITANIGRLDARNPLAVGVFVALQNTTSRVQYVGVLSNDLEGHTLVRDSLTPRPDVYAIVPLTADVSVLAMWNTDCAGLAVPDESRGRPQRFRVTIGSGELTTLKEIIEPQTSGQTVATTGSAPAVINQLTVPGATFIADGVIPGDKLTIALDTGTPDLDGVYTIAQVISDTVLQIDGEFSAADASLDVLATFLIKDATGVTTRRAAAVATSAAAAATAPNLYLTLVDPNGTFLTSGVAAGDVVQLPADYSNDFTGTNSQFVVASVLSENRLLIADNGCNTSTVENELPHGVKRAGGALVPTTATLNYRIVRTLSKAQQVEELVALSESFSSKRLVLVWPDLVNVSGVEGGDSQPGYYAACAVGGMTAGLQPHQGFTFLGIAGISRIYHSNTYFSDSQLTDLSMGGWYVFAQQTPTSLPYTIHQLTTDVSALESGEFSVVKNFDFVSLFFIDILDDFLGQYNVNTETLTLIRAALNIGGETLRLRTTAKIGAPLTSFEIAQLAVSELSGDRVVAYLNIGLPKPLNVIELHLVA
jgi:hypothetical protein